MSKGYPGFEVRRTVHVPMNLTSVSGVRTAPTLLNTDLAIGTITETYRNLKAAR
jgi:hypothetical protein